MNIIKPKFEDHRSSELYELIENTLRDYCSDNNIHLPTAIGILYLLAHDIMHDYDGE